MKVIGVLTLVLLTSACSRDAAEPQSTHAEDAKAATAATGTTGVEATAQRQGQTSAGQGATGGAAQKTPDPSPAKDARAAAASPVAQEAEREGKNPHAAILEDFEKRVDDYMDLRKRAARNAPPLKETEEPARIEAAQESRAANLRALRGAAKPGDIFTPEIRHTFRQLLAPELRGEEGRDVKQVLRDDAPAPGAVPLEVNGTYPENATLPTVPAALLASLPELPEGLEYRIVGKDLVLLDSDANLIVDYIRNAIR